MPSLSSKSRETGELQDVYRRTLAASWAAQPGELRADDCIEDIFAGGDGWGNRDKAHDASRVENLSVGDDSASLSDSDARSSRRHKHSRSGISGFTRGAKNKTRSNEAVNKSDVRHDGASGVRGRSSLEQQAHRMKAEAERRTQKPSYEVNEVDVREDLRSWKLP